MESLGEFSEAIVEECMEEQKPKSRESCLRCHRPKKSACICPQLPPCPIRLSKSKVYVMQHPNEIKRPLNTVAILQACLHCDDCVVFRGKKFTESRYPALHALLQRPNTFLIFPGNNATDMAAIGSGDLALDSYNFVLLDGTWRQARTIYAQNTFLHKLPKMIINNNLLSEYVIRTQPKDKFLSTIECAAIALYYSESQQIKEILLKPLRELCSIQLHNGAVKHESKEAMNRKIKEELPL